MCWRADFAASSPTNKLIWNDVGFERGSRGAGCVLARCSACVQGALSCDSRGGQFGSTKVDACVIFCGMKKLIELIFHFGPLLFGVGFIAPLVAQMVSRSGWVLPLGVSPLVAGLIIGCAWGAVAQVRGRWV